MTSTAVGLPMASSVRGVRFNRELRDDVLAGEITLSVRLWQRPQVKEGGRYRVGFGPIEIDAVGLVPFAATSRRSSTGSSCTR